jgi:hypothetical protein
MPGKSARLDLREKLEDAVEDLRFDAQAFRVQVEKAIAQCLVAFALGGQAEAGVQQAARAARGTGAHRVYRQWLESMLGAQAVDRAAEIRSGIGEGAVEVEEDRAGIAQCASRTVWTR